MACRLEGHRSIPTCAAADQRNIGKDNGKHILLVLNAIISQGQLDLDGM